MAIPFIGKAIEGVISIIDKVVPDKAAAAKAKAEIESMAMKGELDLMLAQIHTNMKEAESESIFVAGWRPFIGWTCGLAFCWAFLIQPFVLFIAAWNKVEIGELPQADISTMMPVLMGLLGLGGLRTYEKITGSNKNR